MSFPIRVGAKALIVENENILLVEYNDETGFHYNLPGGGIEVGESVREGLRREIREEACADARVNELLFVHEYEPGRNRNWGGTVQKLTLVFACSLVGETRPRLPDHPDAHQTGVVWLPLSDLETVELLPHLAPYILAPREGDSAPAYLEEPLDWEKAKRYLTG